MKISGTLPPSFTRCLDPKDRTTPQTQTNQEAGRDPRHRSELKEQGLFAAWLKLQQTKGLLEYFWQRTDKKATGKRGTPDFIIALYGGRSLWIEFKAPGNVPSIEQAQTLQNLAKLAHSALVCHSSEEAIRFVRLRLSVL